MTAALLYPLYPVIWCVGFVYGFCTPEPVAELAYGVTRYRPLKGWIV